MFLSLMLSLMLQITSYTPPLIQGCHSGDTLIVNGVYYICLGPQLPSVNQPVITSPPLTFPSPSLDPGIVITQSPGTDHGILIPTTPPTSPNIYAAPMPFIQYGSVSPKVSYVKELVVLSQTDLLEESNSHVTDFLTDAYGPADEYGNRCHISQDFKALMSWRKHKGFSINHIVAAPKTRSHRFNHIYIP